MVWGEGTGIGRARQSAAALVRGDRAAGFGVAVAATAGLLTLFARTGLEAVKAPAVPQARTTLVYLPPPLTPSAPPESVTVPQNAAARRIVVPDNVPVRPPDDRAQTWITAPPAATPVPQAPLGLRGLMSKDPCLDPAERLRRADCPLEYDPGQTGKLALDIERAHGREQFLAFAARENCSQKHGCMDGDLPTEVMGVRSARPGTAMSAGAASLGGLNESVDRLPPPNWYHVDPAFGD